MTDPATPDDTDAVRVTDTDVVISGAGPVGLTLALALAARGVRTVVLEKKPELDPHSRATLLVPRSLEILAGIGVLPALVAQGEVNPALDILRAGDRSRLLRFDFGAAVDQTAVPFAIAIPQDRTERILLDAAHASRLIDIRFDTPLHGFADTARGVTIATALHGTGTVRARYLVGADGAHSTVRTLLGSTLQGTTYPTRAFLADVRVATAADLPGGWLSDPTAAAFTIAVRFGGDATGGTWRLIESAVPDAVTESDFDGRARDLTERIFGPGAWQTTVWTAAYRKHERRAVHYRRGRVVLAGDAAHLNSPAGGQGLNTGLQDVHALAWRLASLIAGSGDEGRLLDSYHDERALAFDLDVRPLTAGIETMETLPPWLRTMTFSTVGLLRRTRLPQLVASKLSMLTPHPARSTLIGDGAAAGRRIPDITLPDGTRLYTHLGPAGLLLTTTGTTPPELPAGIAVAPIPAGLPTPFSRYDSILVRPDHLVATSSNTPLDVHTITHTLGLHPLPLPTPAT